MIYSILFSSIALFATIEESILPNLEKAWMVDHSKLNSRQKEALEKMVCIGEKPLRVMSFNMLFNFPFAEIQLDEENRWPKRAPRLIEYLAYANPDMIGSQELQKDQIELIQKKLGNVYASYGESETIFYKKERLDLLQGEMVRYSDHSTDCFTVCIFFDKATQKKFRVINVHLTFSNIEKRLQQAEMLADFVKQRNDLPLLLTGDFNTFPFQQNLDIPFYDGETVISTLEKGCIKDSLALSLLGHFGPLSSTNFSVEEKKCFRGLGTPGVILDHLFVSPDVEVVTHGIDPARVDGYFPSDHFPVIADLIF